MEPQAILKSAMEVCPLAIVIVDPLGNIVLANGEMERMFGYAPDEFIGRSIDIVVPAELRAKHAQHRSQFADHAEIRMTRNRRLRGVRKDGTEFPVEIGLNRVHTKEGLWSSG